MFVSTMKMIVCILRPVLLTVFVSADQSGRWAGLRALNCGRCRHTTILPFQRNISLHHTFMFWCASLSLVSLNSKDVSRCDPPQAHPSWTFAQHAMHLVVRPVPQYHSSEGRATPPISSPRSRDRQISIRSQTQNLPVR